MPILIEGEYLEFFSKAKTEIPERCPVCNKVLRERWGWWTTERDRFYPYMVCYGRKPRWLINLYKRMAIVTPLGAHYAYRLPSVPDYVERGSSGTES